MTTGVGPRRATLLSCAAAYALAALCAIVWATSFRVQTLDREFQLRGELTATPTTQQSRPVTNADARTGVAAIAYRRQRYETLLVGIVLASGLPLPIVWFTWRLYMHRSRPRRDASTVADRRRSPDDGLRSTHPANAQSILHDRRIGGARDARLQEQAKSNFVATVSHHFRQPLQALNLFIGGLEPGAGIDQREALAHMRNSVGAMTRLLDAMLVIAHLDAGVIDAQPRAIRVSELFAAERAMLSAHAARRNVNLIWREPDAVLRTDPALAAQMLRHLATNAIDHAPPNSGCVLIAARRRTDRVRIEVRDNGAGIAPGDQARIFDEFVQIDEGGADARRHGYGLGLTSCARIATLLSTQIAVRSGRGNGSVFWFDLPVAPAMRANTAQATGTQTGVRCITNMARRG